MSETPQTQTTPEEDRIAFLVDLSQVQRLHHEAMMPLFEALLEMHPESRYAKQVMRAANQLNAAMVLAEFAGLAPQLEGVLEQILEAGDEDQSGEAAQI